MRRCCCCFWFLDMAHADAAMFLASQRLFLASQRREELERPITATEAAARIAIRYEAYVAGRYEYRPSPTADRGRDRSRACDRCRTRDRSRTRSRSSRSPQPRPRRSPRRRMSSHRRARRNWQRLTGSLHRLWAAAAGDGDRSPTPWWDGHPSLAALVPRLAELA